MDLQFDRFVLAAPTADLSEEPRAREHADAVEFRMDLADDPLAALERYDGDLPLIVTNRASWEGGESPEGGRFDALEAALEREAVAAVDIELAALAGGEPAADAEGARRVRETARERGAAVVASVHDFEATPEADDLASLLAAAATEGDVGKLATTVRNRGDALRLLSVTHEATDAGLTVATMGMGEAGRHTRAVAPVYGSRIGYAPVNPASATAPGQYDLAALADLVRALGVRR